MRKMGSRAYIYLKIVVLLYYEDVKETTNVRTNSLYLRILLLFGAIAPYICRAVAIWCRDSFKEACRPALIRTETSVIPLVIPNIYFTHTFIYFATTIVYQLFGRGLTIDLFGWYWGIDNLQIWVLTLSVLEFVLRTSYYGIECLPNRPKNGKNA